MKALLGFTLLVATNFAQACVPNLSGDGVVRIESPRYVLAFRTFPKQIAVGEPFSMDIDICNKKDVLALETLRVDAQMPIHRHGMNYAPTVQRVANGRWRAEGLLFHMPGPWEFRFDLRAREMTDHLTHSYQLD